MESCTAVLENLPFNLGADNNQLKTVEESYLEVHIYQNMKKRENRYNSTLTFHRDTALLQKQTSVLSPVVKKEYC